MISIPTHVSVTISRMQKKEAVFKNRKRFISYIAIVYFAIRIAIELINRLP